MQLAKTRLESFSDGVIAIIITIMMLSIPLPSSFKSQELLQLLLAIFIYFISFLVVGSFWSGHNLIFKYIDRVTIKIFWANLLYLFFLSLIPIFTKWVIENPGKLIPAISYDVVFLLVNLCYILIFRTVSHDHTEDLQVIREHLKQKAQRKRQEAPPGATWIRFAILAAAAVFIIVGSIFIPAVSTFFLLGLPVVFSVVNLFSDRESRKKQRQSQDTDMAAQDRGTDG